MHRNLVLLFLGLLPCVNGLWASVEKTVLVHYVPLFSTKTENQNWGWHYQIKIHHHGKIPIHSFPLLLEFVRQRCIS